LRGGKKIDGNRKKGGGEKDYIVGWKERSDRGSE
jgi:hypothetical protein